MAAQTDDKKLDGAGLGTLWGIIKQYIADNPSIPKATASVLGGIMVGTTLAIDNSGVLNLASGIVTAGTYKSVTVDTYGRVTAGSNPNTLQGYGITDAKIVDGAIILGADSITPATQTWVQQQGYTTNIGTVTQVKVGKSAYDPSSGIVSLPAYPTTLPASDVYSWAKASTKPSYSWSEISSRPTALSSFTNDSGYITGITSSMVTTALGYTPANSTALSNYLPLSGGTLSNSLIIGGTDIVETGANLASYASVHSIKFYRNGFLIPYQADDTNDGGMLRVRGTNESNAILELGMWDDSGAGETIQFNYYPTTSTVTPTYSVTVPKASGTLALTSQIPTNNNQLTNGAGYITSSGSCNYATSAGSANYASSAGSVAWSNVSGRPTALSSFANDSGYVTSSSLSLIKKTISDSSHHTVIATGLLIIGTRYNGCGIYHISYGAKTRIGGFNYDSQISISGYDCTIVGPCDIWYFDSFSSGL